MTGAPALMLAAAVVALGMGVGRAVSRARLAPQPRAAALAELVPDVVSDAAAKLPMPPAVHAAAGLLGWNRRPVGRLRVLGALAGGLVGGALVAIGPLPWPLALVGMGLGLAGGDLRVVAEARSRRDEVARGMPDALDLLHVALRAGMPLDGALQLVGEHVGGPLHTELRRLENEVALGVPRSHAYRALATRIGSDDVSRAMAALRRADQLGVPVADALRRQADDFRRARELRARERAATAGPKIQLIVALLMVPSTLFLVIGLLLIQLTRQINAVIGL